MARSETVLQVFVASPGDVREERESLESIIAELNRTWSKTLGVRLELLRWETSTHPAAGNDPQDVVNSQITDEYDIFIGILWGRIGTETPRSQSGTIEEFERAYARWQSDSCAVEIMFYFKDTPIKPSAIDTQQLLKVQKFRESLGDEGIYHWSFQGLENFESSVRAHLSSVAQKWAKKYAGSATSSSIMPAPASAPPSPPSLPESEEDDLGFFDHIELFESSMERMVAALNGVADATVTVGEHMNLRSAEINEIGDIKDPERLKRAKRTMKFAAEDMGRFSDMLANQLPLMTSSRKDAFEALSKALSLYSDFEHDDSQDIDDLEVALKSMTTAGGGALVSINGFRSTVDGMPRMTSDLNRAKRRVLKAVDLVLLEIQTTIETADSIATSLPGHG